MTATNTRRGFTLVELLVAIGVLIALAAIAVVALPDINKQRGVDNAAAEVQGYLLIAKNRSARDKVERGVRFTFDTSTGLCRSVQYIGRPDNYVPPTGSTLSATGGGGTAPTTVTLTVPSTETVTSFLQAGDVLEIAETGSVYSLLGVTGSGTTYTLTITPGLEEAAGLSGTYSLNDAGFRFVRTPRPLLGEKPLQLDQDVAINFDSSAAVTTQADFTLTSGRLDILFTPTGTAYTLPDANARAAIIFAMTDESLDPSAEARLLTVYPKTGAIGSFKPNTGTANIYQDAEEGQNFGL